jgi:hypothetical protein
MKLLTVLLCTALLSAQDPWSNVQAIPAGSQVRVETATHKPTGDVVSVSDDSIRLGSITVPRSEVMRVYLKSTSHRKRNTIIGAAIGVGVGLRCTLPWAGYLVTRAPKGLRRWRSFPPRRALRLAQPFPAG